MFEKIDRPERIIQFGEGGFLRGFADWMIQKLNDKGLFCGNIVAVQPIKDGMCDTLSAQNCVYTHIIRGKEGSETSIINSISRCVKPYDDYGQFLDLAKEPQMRYIISNTTEAGIVFSKKDKFDDAPPETFPAKITALLYRRFELSLDGFIILPCELIDRNGDTLKECVLKYAELWNLGEEFSQWICEKNIFTNTLVDRINTGYPKGEVIELPYTDRMLNTSEYFHLWVIETDYDLEKELPFSKAGLNVIITENELEKYRTRKVRILNGAHTSMVAHGLLSGFDTVRSCTEDEKMLRFIKKCIFEEIIPTLDMPKDELTEYANQVLVRFSNPYINHYLSSILLNSVSKFKVRVLPSVLEYIKRYGRMPKNLIFAFKRLIEYYKTQNPSDNEETVKYIKEHSLYEILQNKTLWGEDISFLCNEIEGAENAD